MSAIWVSKESWQTLWSAIRNIQIRMDRTVLKPSACFSGQGTAARIRIDLPLASGGGNVYDGPFKVTVDPEENRMTVSPGSVLANGDFFETEETSLELKEGYVCVHIELGKNGEWSAPEIIAGAEPGALNVPVARILYEVGEDRNGETAGSWIITQYRVPRAVFILAGYECPIADGVVE